MNIPPITSSTALGAGPPPPGSRALSEPTKIVATAALATISAHRSRIPVQKPTYGPNAASTYAYAPPLTCTRLPTSAKHSPKSATRTAHTMYASIAAGPRIAVTTAGSTKIPDPTIVFTMFAASARTPSARTSSCSSTGAAEGATRGVVMRQCIPTCGSTTARLRQRSGCGVQHVQAFFSRVIEGELLCVQNNTAQYCIHYVTNNSVRLRLLRISSPFHTNRVRRFLVACLDSSGPRHGDSAPVRRGSYEARLSEFSHLGITNRREYSSKHQSPTAHESGDGVSGRTSANRRCVAKRTSRAPCGTPSGVHRCAALGAPCGAVARADQGRLVRHSRRDLACEIDARRRASQLRHLHVCRRVLREPGIRRAEGARASSIA